MDEPLILLITADELRKDSLSCYGNKAINTPNLDSLAAEGIQFNRGYTVSPWCLPSRCSILTGLFPHNSGAYSNFRKCSLNNGVHNMFTELKKMDYFTSMFGKCHFAPVSYTMAKPDATLPYDDFKSHYTSLGIDYLKLQDGNQVSVWFYDDYSKELDNAGYLKSYRDSIWDEEKAKVFPFPGPPEWHPDNWVGKKAVEFLEKYEEKKPLFTWVSFSGPHYPFDTPSQYLDRVDVERMNERILHEGEFDDERRIHHRSYNGPGGIDGSGSAPGHACKNYSEEYWNSLRRSYLANVTLMDDQVGDIIYAAKSKFGDNILIIFSADHGEMLGNHGLWGKNNCGYEDVWNVPLLVKYPNETKALKSEAMVMLTDILPTCLKAAGGKPMKCDGVDFKENIEHGGYKYVFAEGEGYIAVSNGEHKYIHVRKPGEEFYELLDLHGDPSECINVIDRSEYQELLADLRKQAINHFMEKLLP